MELLEVDATDHAGRRSRRTQTEGRRHRGRRFAVALAVATAALAAPAAALAANPPTLLTAGIDKDDQLYSTWSLAPGTTFDFVTYATVPDPNPGLPQFFASGNFAGFCDAESLSTTCTTTSHVAQFPSPRDRRFFVKVSAKVTGTENDYLNSAIWVIDETKPQIPGDAPLGSVEGTNKPVAGHQLATVPPPPGTPPPVAPPPAAPAAAVKALTLPKTIGSLLTKGVRLQVACTVTCSPFGRLTLGSPTLGTKQISMVGGGLRVLTVKPSAAGRKRLRGRSRARVKIAVAVEPTGGTTVKYSKSFTVRR